MTSTTLLISLLQAVAVVGEPVVGVVGSGTMDQSMQLLKVLEPGDCVTFMDACSVFMFLVLTW